MPRFKPGDKAPDFTLKDLEGKDFRLHANLNGKKTLLLFFRAEWCPICNVQVHSLQEKLADFEKDNAQIIAVSTDNAENSLKLVEKHGLGFPVLVGLTRDIIEAYDLYYNESKECAEPAHFILKTDGTIAYVSSQSGPAGRPSTDDLLRILSRY